MATNRLGNKLTTQESGGKGVRESAVVLTRVRLNERSGSHGASVASSRRRRVIRRGIAPVAVPGLTKGRDSLE